MTGLERATFAGGCFWCLEAVFEIVEGVRSVKSGYSGGHVPNPSYNAICTGRTGHAEVVQIDFDQVIVSYAELLKIFFGIHDPTTLNRQGADTGTQYRSAIYTHSDKQLTSAREMLAALEADGPWDSPIVTEVVPLDVFYPAEDDHSAYYRRNEAQPYCQLVIAPKLAEFRQRFSHKLRAPI